MRDPQISLVAGLGNPGPEYVGTRHNVGFAALELFARQIDAKWEREKKSDALVARSSGVVLLKPTTFMNHSGYAIAAVARFHKIAPANILVVLDDFALPLGRLRIRQRGGPGGHNGLESVIINLGTEEFPRLRLGIGAAPARGSVDYVLSTFFDEEKAGVAAMLERAAEAIKCAIDKGVVSAMNTFNSEPEEKQEEK